MKNFIITTLLFTFWSCQPETNKEQKPIEVKVRMAGASVSALLYQDKAPQTAAHLINLMDQNIFDGANITKKNEHIIISPDSRAKTELTSIKIPQEQSTVKQNHQVWGLIRSPILEEGDSRLYFCENNCQNLETSFIAVGTYQFSKPDQFESIKSGEKVLTVLKK